MVVAFTGHRPHKIPGEDIHRLLFATIRELSEVRPVRVITGMAPGYDIIGLHAARELSIPATAAIPWIGHGTSPAWGLQGLDEYIRNLELCDTHEVVCEGEDYRPWFYQKRNEWMVDRADVILAAWDGSDGGTANCVRYARRLGKAIRYYQWDDLGTFGDEHAPRS